MTSFRAFRIHQDDGQVRAGFEELTIDDLTAGDVVVRVAYSGINYKDALAATEWIPQQWPAVELFLAGFSLGGAVAFRLAAVRVPRSLVTVAPAVDRIPRHEARPDCAWLIVQGERDDVVSAEKVQSWGQAFDPPPQIEVLPGVGHFFHGRLTDLRKAVHSYVGTVED